MPLHHFCPFSPFFSPLSLRHGFVVVYFEVTICELLCLDGLRHVISGVLAGGIPGARATRYPSGDNRGETLRTTNQHHTANKKTRTTTVTRHRNTPTFFFSSSMADVALWLGPYMSISSKNVICTRTEKARKCRQITTNQPSHRPARRPANPPARLAFRQKKQQTRHTKRGKSPNKNTHKKICHRTQWSDHCITLKNMHTMN